MLPTTLYNEASTVLLNPQRDVRLDAGDRRREHPGRTSRSPSLLSLDQSLLIVWPHVVALLALTVACFAIAYVLFMRQEVRA